MERNDFDKRLRERLEGVTETAPDVWEGISKGLARRRRLVIFRRFSVAVAAAAAVVALALLVFRNPRTGDQVTAPVQTAQVEQPAVAPAAPVEAPVEVAPIQEQVKQFTQHRAVAAAKVDKKTPQPAEPTDPAETELPVEESAVQQQPSIVQPVNEQPAVEPADNRLTEDQLPADFWTREGTLEDPSIDRTRRTHTSQISILSNLTTTATDGDLLYIPSPMHASSQSGKSQAVSDIEPYSTSKFYAPLTFGLQVAFPLTDRFSVATGVSYSYLVSQYDILYKKVMYEGAYNQLHYVGVPLSLSYHFVQTPHLGVYAAVTGAAEKCVAQRYVFGSNVLSEKVTGLQWSAKAGIGVEYWFIPHMGIYFDPSLIYFFDNKQPLSIRTQQPLQANFEVGLRFKI